MTPDPPTHRLEWLPLHSLVPNPANPKGHDLETIKASLRRHGFTEPLLLDERTGQLAAGHGRAEALAEMRDADPMEVRPKGVDWMAGTGDWMVPVVRGWSSPDDIEGNAYLVTSNQLTMTGGWEQEALAEVLRELADHDALDGTGFTADDLDHLLASMGDPGDPEPAPDQSERLVTRHSVVVDVPDDASQRALIDRLSEEGYPCRALNS